MSNNKRSVNHVQEAILNIEALMYQRNQAYAFIAMQGIARDFLTFIEERQCERATDEELKMLLELYTPKNEK